MENLSLLDAIEPKAMDAIAERADAIADGDKPSDLVRAAMALGSVPIMLGALATTASAQAVTPTVIDVLNFALLLENLESEFYKAVLGTSSVAAFNNAFATVRAALPGANATIIPTLQLLSAHEKAHVAFLTTTLNTLQAGSAKTYDPASTFDFTGGRGAGNGPFATATQDPTFLLAATQGFEDTGVRAYKGQAGKLLGTIALKPALQIHALEARHASRIRRLRRTLDTANTQVRYSGTVKGDGAAAAGAPTGASLPGAVVTAFGLIYAGEGNTKHTVNNGSADVTIDASALAGLASGTDVTLAFDEPLTAGQVAAIVQPFIVQDVTSLIATSNLA
ncbi:MAG TPA: ferritin-like domain-containing protein [Gemmatirosa sp.]